MTTYSRCLLLTVVLCATIHSVHAADPPGEGEKKYGPMPWHLVDIWWDAGEKQPFESLAVDVTISDDVSDTVNLYLSPIGLGHLNKTQFYGGLQTHVDGNTRQDSKLRQLGPGFLFSMWGERSLDAIRTSPNGFLQSSGHEGDFVSVRHPYAWKKGKYTYRLDRLEEQTIDGAAFTWVGASVYSREKDEKAFVGALRFKGKDLMLDGKVANFVELYGRQKPVSEIPKLVVTFGPPVINGLPAKSPGAEALYPRGVPDYANAVAKDGKLEVTVGEHAAGRTERRVKLLERGK